MKISISRTSIYWLVVVALSLVIGFSQYAHAWTSPSAAPTGGNVAGPLTVGPVSQTKAGDLGAQRFCLPGSNPSGGCIATWPSGGVGDITGSGAMGKITKWKSTSALENSIMEELPTSIFGMPSVWVRGIDGNPKGALGAEVVAANYALFSPTWCGSLGSCFYQVTPGGTSNMHIIYLPPGGYISAPVFYDNDAGGYSMDPSGQSNMHNIVADNIQSGTFAYTASDASLKKDVKTIPNALEKILKLRGVEFNWKKDNAPSVGLIAQEVEGVFPQLVGTNPTTGVKGVQYEGLVGPLIEAVKEQQKEIEELRREIEELKR